MQNIKLGDKLILTEDCPETYKAGTIVVVTKLDFHDKKQSYGVSTDLNAAPVDRNTACKWPHNKYLEIYTDVPSNAELF